MKKILNFKILNIIVLIPIVFVITISRLFQIFYFTDYEIACDNFVDFSFSKFFYFNSKTLSYGIYSLICIYLLFLVIFLLLKKNKNENLVSFSSCHTKVGLKSKILLLTFSIVTFIYAILYYFETKKLNLKIKSIVILTIISQFLLSAYFLYFFICIFFKKYDKNNISNIIFVFPLFYSIVRMLNITFINYFLMLTPEENILNIFKVTSFSLFFFYFGKFLIGLNSKNNEKYLKFFGSLTVFFSSICLLPRFIAFFKIMFSSNKENFLKQRTFFINLDIINAANFVILDLIVLSFVLTFLSLYFFRWEKAIKK